jgi:hypothetical protein
MSSLCPRARTLRLFFVGSLVAASAFTNTNGAQVMPDQVPVDAPSARHAELNTLLGLRDSTLIELSTNASPGEAVVTTLAIEGETFTLDLHPHSIRASTYQVLAQLADGSLVSVEPGPVRTLRGTVREIPGSIVAGALLEDGLHARIVFAASDDYWLEPIRAHTPDALPGEYVVYRSADVIGGVGACAVEDVTPHEPAHADASGNPPDGQRNRDALCIAEFAADADYEYFQAYGSVAAVEDRINDIINAVDVEYERDVGITHVITAIIVRTAEPDPYDNPPNYLGQLLEQFEEQWLTYHTNIHRDVAQLFTGKELSCPGIGIARLSSVCTDDAFSLVKSDFDPAFACVTQLTAHELGHNWGADHCVYAYTMNPTIWGWNEFHPVDTIPEIIAFCDTRTCLDTGGGGSPPLAPSDLNATAVSSSQIDLAWTDNADNELGFEIERSEDDGTTWGLIAVVGSDVTSYSDSGLAAGATYLYRALAYNYDGDSPYSNTASATTQAFGGWATEVYRPDNRAGRSVQQAVP